jgi:hypothetical protein
MLDSDIKTGEVSQDIACVQRAFMMIVLVQLATVREF